MRRTPLVTIFDIECILQQNIYFLAILLHVLFQLEQLIRGTYPTVQHKDVALLNIHRTDPVPVSDGQKGNTKGHFIPSVR